MWAKIVTLCREIKQAFLCDFGKHQQIREHLTLIGTVEGRYFSAVAILSEHPYGVVIWRNGNRFVQHFACQFCGKEVPPLVPNSQPLTRRNVMWAIVIIGISLLLSACAPYMVLHVERLDGRVKNYQASEGVDGSTTIDEIWNCQQTEIGQRRAKYSCEARLLEQ
jgi:hypothetical protein